MTAKRSGKQHDGKYEKDEDSGIWVASMVADLEWKYEEPCNQSSCDQ